MSSDTGTKIHAYHWEDDLPIPYSVSEKVVELASSENIPSLQNQSPIF